jgi:hypothetical protein
MDNVRGLRTRLCPKCCADTPHRTLYVRAPKDGERRWLQIFWACTKCGSLNHIVLPAYRLSRISSPLPSVLAIGIVNALEDGPLDFDGLVTGLRLRHPAGIQHVFNSEVTLTLEFLESRGVVEVESRDSTRTLIDAMNDRQGKPSHLAVCPAGSTNSLVSLYAQKQKTGFGVMRLVPAGVYCLHCRYQRVNM